jgi:hypothetical protein
VGSKINPTTVLGFTTHLIYIVGLSLLGKGLKPLLCNLGSFLQFQAKVLYRIVKKLSDEAVGGI